MCVFVRFMHFRHNLLPSSLSQSYQILAILMQNLAIVDLEFLWHFTQSVISKKFELCSNLKWS